VGLEGAWEQVSSKIILKKNAVSVKERWGAGQLEDDHEKAAAYQRCASVAVRRVRVP
jgi:hypothetical protein